MGSVRPISPDEVASCKAAAIPDPVLEVFNALIAKKWNGTRAVVTLREARERIEDAMGAHDPGGFDSSWLDVEDAYRAQGWDVVYDSPGYCETYPATFTFTRAA